MSLNRLKQILVLGCVIWLSGCSLFKPKEDAGSDTPPPSADAGTDAVPQTKVETPAAPADVVPVAPVTPPVASTPVESTPAPAAAGGTPEDYTVHSGDTLMKIAFELYGDVYQWKKIYEANKDKITDPNQISKGIVLKIDKGVTPVSVDRTGEKYLIKKGDTLGTISGALYGSPDKWKKIWEFNKQLVHDPNRIFAGFYLYYLTNADEMKAKPDGAISSPPAEIKASPTPAAVPAPVSSVAAPRPPVVEEKKEAAPAITPPPVAPPASSSEALSPPPSGLDSPPALAPPMDAAGDAPPPPSN